LKENRGKGQDSIKIMGYDRSQDPGDTAMRGRDVNTGTRFSYVRWEARVARDHRLRAIPEMVNAAVFALSPEALCAKPGRPSIPPGKLLPAPLAAGLVIGALGASSDRAARLKRAPTPAAL
jgi:hypothetical protein